MYNYVYRFKKTGSGIYQYKINNNVKILEENSVKYEYVFRVYSSLIYWEWNFLADVAFMWDTLLPTIYTTWK